MTQAVHETGLAIGFCTWTSISHCSCYTCLIRSVVRCGRYNRPANFKKFSGNLAAPVHRWAIEIFSRFFKHVLGCRHLLSYCQNGIELQTYSAIIACLLISLWTGRKPTLRTYEMPCWYFTGMADEEELLAHIERLGKQD